MAELSAEARELAELAELEKRAAEARKKSDAKVTETDRAVRRTKAEEQIKLAELDDSLGVCGRDYLPVFCAKTGRMAVVVTPSEVAWQKVSQKQLDGKLSIKEMVELVYGCLRYPDRSKFETLCSTTPGMLGQASDACSRLATDREAEIAGK